MSEAANFEISRTEKKLKTKKLEAENQKAKKVEKKIRRQKKSRAEKVLIRKS